MNGSPRWKGHFFVVPDDVLLEIFGSFGEFRANALHGVFDVALDGFVGLALAHCRSNLARGVPSLTGVALVVEREVPNNLRDEVQNGSLIRGFPHFHQPILIFELKILTPHEV